MADLERVRVWAEALIRLHLDDSWSFDFDRAARRAGLTNYTARRITVSKHLAARWDDDDVHQTLLHEVAHAIAGPGAGHGPQWLRTARELGYVGGRTHQGEIATERANWVGTCPGGHEFLRFRRPRGRYGCPACTRSARRFIEVRWARREREAA